MTLSAVFIGGPTGGIKKIEGIHGFFIFHTMEHRYIPSSTNKGFLSLHFAHVRHQYNFVGILKGIAFYYYVRPGRGVQCD